MSNNFKRNLIIGTQSEDVFLNDFVHFLNIPCNDVRNNINYRKIGVDFLLLSQIKIEIKTAPSNNYLYFEEYKIYKSKNYKVPGWIYTSKCDFFVLVNAMREIFFIKNDNNFKQYYETIIKKNYPLKLNNNRWIRVVKKSALAGFCSIYKKTL